MTKKKVYILDHELVSPIAVGRENILDAIKTNKSADRAIQSMDVAGLPFRQAAEVQEDLTHLYLNESAEVKAVCEHDRKLELLAAAYGLAAQRMKPFINAMNPERTGVVMGVGAEIMRLKENEPYMVDFIENELNSVCELMITLNQHSSKYNRISNPYDVYTQYLANKFNAQAFQKSILTACVSSTQAFAQGYDMILRGEADVVIAGGTDSIVNLIALISFGKLGVISETDGKVSCKPFDNNRKGTIAGEAAGFAIMCSEEFAENNGFKPLVSMLGYGNTLDGFKITAPDPEASAMSKAIADAVKNSGIEIDQLDYYYAHGTGTRQNDGVELKAIRDALGDKAFNIPISSTKDRHGHAIAAAGNQELSILIELMKAGYIPENMNLDSVINFEMQILKAPAEKEIKFALKSNFAFGGINTVLCLENEQ